MVIVPRALALRQTRDTSKQEPHAGLRLLNLNEVSDILRISKHGLYRLIRARELKSVHIGKRHLVRLEELQRFIELHESKAGA